MTRRRTQNCDHDIGDAQSGDLAPLTALFIDFKKLMHSKGHAYDTLSANADHVIKRKLKQAIAKPKTICLIAREGDTLCGFLLAHEDTLPEYYEISSLGHITDLFVAESCRRRGMGTALIKAAERAFKARNIDHVRLETTVINPENKPFYESLGFELFIYELRKRTGN